MDRVPPEYVDAFSISVGSINILAGIITTISQFLKLNELVENHRVSYISWDKFYRNIRAFNDYDFTIINICFYFKKKTGNRCSLSKKINISFVCYLRFAFLVKLFSSL
mgnify:CR=1 FL=1